MKLPLIITRGLGTTEVYFKQNGPTVMTIAGTLGIAATAVLTARSALKAQPKGGAFLYARGAALFRAGKHPEAVAQLEKALKMEPKWEGHVNTLFGSYAIQDWANPAQLNRLDWYSAHDWKVPYPGDIRILPPNQVPGHNLPAGYLGD